MGDKFSHKRPTRQREFASSVSSAFEKRGWVMTEREKIKDFKRVPTFENPDFDRYFAGEAVERRSEDGARVHRPIGHSKTCKCKVCKKALRRKIVTEKPITPKEATPSVQRKVANFNLKKKTKADSLAILKGHEDED